MADQRNWPFQSDSSLASSRHSGQIWQYQDKKRALMNHNLKQPLRYEANSSEEPATTRQLPFLSHRAVAQSVCRSFNSTTQQHWQHQREQPVVNPGPMAVYDQHLLADPQAGLYPYLTGCHALSNVPPYFRGYIAQDRLLPPSPAMSSLTTGASSSTGGDTSKGHESNCRYCNGRSDNPLQRSTSLDGFQKVKDLETCRNTQTHQQPNQEITCSLLSSTVPLWRFLLDLLMDKNRKNIIAWTGRRWEFRFIDKHEVARLWGLRKNKLAMNYEKLSRGLRYYYDKNIIQKTPDKRFTYYYVCDLQHIVRKTYEQVHAELGTAPATEEESDWASI